MAIPSSGSDRASTRLVLRESADVPVPGTVDGAWWPRTRSLTDELPTFFAAWPADRGRIHRILYSPPDWEDHPHSVAVGDRRVKTGSFPRDDTHQLTVTLADRSSRVITVIDPGADQLDADRVMHDVNDGAPGPVDQPAWDDDGGRP